MCMLVLESDRHRGTSNPARLGSMVQVGPDLSIMSNLILSFRSNAPTWRSTFQETKLIPFCTVQKGVSRTRPCVWMAVVVVVAPRTKKRFLQPKIYNAILCWNSHSISHNTQISFGKRLALNRAKTGSSSSTSSFTRFVSSHKSSPYNVSSSQVKNCTHTNLCCHMYQNIC